MNRRISSEKISLRKPLFFLFFLLLAAGTFSYGQGDLLVYPTRLVFNGTQNRVQIMNLNNRGADTTTYEISYIQNRMNENGDFIIINEPDSGQRFASPYLRFYPRTITLAPKETQVVKVQLINTSKLTDGEYRSHLYFRPVPKPQVLESEENKPNSEEGLSISIKPVYGVSVANIIRVGEPDANISLTHLKLEHSDDPVLSMQFNRSGAASSYGDVEVTYISPEGIETIVGEMKGFAVYTPGTIRKTRVALKQLEGVDYSSGKLRVQYLKQNSGEVISNAVIQL